MQLALGIAIGLIMGMPIGWWLKSYNGKEPNYSELLQPPDLPKSPVQEHLHKMRKRDEQ